MSRIERADARRNRERVLSAARRAFADDGLETPIREVARRAEVGIATVYRHFPTRTDLVAAVLAERVATCRAEMRDALADPDPWQALSGTIRQFAQRQLEDRALNEAMLGSGPQFRRERREQARGLETLVARAHAAGLLRPEVDVHDVRAGLVAIASVRGQPPARRAMLIRRLTTLILEGIRGSIPSQRKGQPGK